MSCTDLCDAVRSVAATVRVDTPGDLSSIADPYVGQLAVAGSEDGSTYYGLYVYAGPRAAPAWKIV